MATSKMLAMPFRTDGTGQIAAVTTIQEQIAQRVRSVIGTSPGERVMRPGYGSGAAAYLYEVNDLVNATQLVSTVSEALKTWEPAIVVEDVGVSHHDPANGYVELTVAYRMVTTGERHSTIVTVAATATYGWPAI